MKTKTSIAVIICFICATGQAAESIQLQREMRNLQIDHRMDQIRQDMKAVSDASMSSISSSISGSTARSFMPSLPAYSTTLPLSSNYSSMNISPEGLEQYLERLGDPEKNTGIYAYPPGERLYHYGKMCIDVGLVAEGIRAISEHTRIQAEQATRFHQNEGISPATHED